VARTTQDLQVLDMQLADEAFYRSDPELVSNSLRRRAGLQSDIEALEQQWFDLQQQLEQIDRDAAR